MNFTDEEKQQMFIELVEGPSRDSFPQPNFTTREYAAMRHLPHDTALKRLMRARERGRLDSATLVLDGHNQAIWWAKESPPRREG